MKLFVRSSSVALTQPVRSYIERRVRMVMGRFGRKIARVSVRISDVNGPRGGVDTLCRIEARFWGRLPVVVEDAADDLRRAIDRSIHRMGRAVARVAAKRLETPRDLSFDLRA
jgi:ribosome-associated translation inhibitor RaiA